MDQIARLAACGVVGAGGGGFPTHAKLNARADVVIINGAECEPLLRADQLLMEAYPEKLLEALEQMMELVGAAEGVVALKAHYHGAVRALEAHLGGRRRLRLYKMGSFYPAGDEHVLVYEVTGRIVAEGGIPLGCGAVVVNVETALNVLAALAEDKPVTHTWVTVTGAVRRPCTLRLPVGLPVQEALELAGGAAAPDIAVVNGGPMMGKLVPLNSVVAKTTKGLIALPKSHPLVASFEKPLARSIREAGAACMQCTQCTVTCPRNLLGHRLEPHKLMRVAAYGSTCDAGEGIGSVYLCSACRLCEYSCVMGLQPWKLNAFLKAELAAKGVKNPMHNQPKAADPFREYKRFPTGKLNRLLGITGYDVAAPLEEAPAPPQRVEIPLLQGAGAPAQPVVFPGEAVAEGALLGAIPEGRLGSSVHASMAGVVESVTKEAVVLARA